MDSKTLNLAILAFSHFRTTNGSNFAILKKLKGLGLPGGFKNVKFSHFGTPNGSNFAIFKNLKGLGLSGEDSKTLNLATLAPQMAQILRFNGLGLPGHPKWLKFCDFEKIEGFRPAC